MRLNITCCVILLIGWSCGQTEFDATANTSNYAKFVEVNNEFAIKVYQRLKIQDGNVFFCPYCIMSSLSLLLEGADGKSEVEINTSLGFKFNRLDKRDVREAFTYFNTRIRQAIPNIANALFMQTDPWVPSEDFINIAQDIYNTQIREVNFSDNPQQAVWDINELVRADTNGNIKHLLERVDTQSQMLLVNALQFRTNFMGIFDSNVTRKARFYNHGVEDHQLEVYVMGNQRVSCKIANSYDFRALELPFEDSSSSLALWIFLPHKRGFLADVEDGLSAEIFKEVKESLTDLQAQILIPKIKFDFFKDITKDLQRLGIHAAFSTSDSNFRTMTKKKDLVLSQVLQKGILEINEPKSNNSWSNASETNEFLNGVEPFIANHPFVLCVVDKNSGMIIYLGRVFEF